MCKAVVTQYSTYPGCQMFDVCAWSGNSTVAPLNSYSHPLNIASVLHGAKALNEFMSLETEFSVPINWKH